jgi:hypothetical protein
VHEGGYGLTVTDDGVFVFTRPDGRRVEDNGAKCFCGNISAADLDVAHRDAGLTITADTGRCQWLGERMDYSVAIEAMQFLEQKAAQISMRPTQAP